MSGKTVMSGISMLFFFMVSAGCFKREMPKFQDGDIIFQDTRSAQSEALRIAMNSYYTHVGVIFSDGDEQVVYEAVGPVKYTLLENWIQQGVGGHFVVKRLSGADRYFAGDAIARLRRTGERYAGLPYDSLFGWSNEKFYCSELVWKMYESALGIRIGELQKFSDFNLSDPVVAEIIKERFPDGIPEDEVVISPASMFDSELLVTVYEH